MKIRLFLICWMITACPGPVLAQHALPTDVNAFEVPAEHWLSDLALLDDIIRTSHPRGNQADFLPVWSEAVDAARAALPGETPGERLLRLHRLIALLEDGHSNIVPFYLPTAGFERQLPLRFYDFADGLFITATSEALSDLAGARILSIGDVPVADVMADIGTLIGADNPQWARNWAVIALRYQAYLAAFGWADGETVRLRLEMPEGGIQILRIAFTEDAATPVSARTINPDRFRTDRNYDFTLVDDRKTVLMIYNAVADRDDESLAAFAERLFDLIEARGIDRLIIDMRDNGGGNNYLNQPFLHRMIGSRVNRPGGLFILTGRQTFSAAMNFSTRAERHTQALLVGEATGGAPNHYGDPAVMILPGTGLPVLTSTLFWQDSAPDDDRRALYPDLSVPERFTDWQSDHDAALAAALDFDSINQAPSLPGLRWTRESQQIE